MRESSFSTPIIGRGVFLSQINDRGSYRLLSWTNVYRYISIRQMSIRRGGIISCRSLTYPYDGIGVIKYINSKYLGDENFET